MTNRYEELSPANQKAIDRLVNALASNRHLGAGHTVGEIDAARKCIDLLGRAVMSAK